MSVLACERYGCRNVMCDILVENRYVCNDCMMEFRKSVGNKVIVADGDSGVDSMSILELWKEFQAFMDSEKPEYVEDRIVTLDEFLTRRDEHGEI